MPCKTLNDLMPCPSLEGKELEKYWIDKFTNFITSTDSSIPLWVKRQYWKYEDDEISSEEENEDESNKYFTDINAAVHDNSRDIDSLDGDPTARRCDGDFYQNVEDQCLLRNDDEPDVEPNEMIHIINISNPDGHDFMQFAKDKTIPYPTEINRRLKALKNMKATPMAINEINLTGNQKIAQEIINNYVRNWILAREGKQDYPKSLRFF